jgi:2-alkenal reductase
MKMLRFNSYPKILWILLLLPLLTLACRAAVPESEAAVLTQPENKLPQITPVVNNFTQSPAILQLPPQVTDEQGLLIALYQMVNPSVVNITIYATENGILIPVGQGSGFLIDAQGNLVTNAHVVHGAEAIEVSFADGSIREATLVGEDLNSDLAVININQIPAGVAPLILGNINNVAVGQTVVAIGNPFGLDGTLTRGIVSALGRTIPALTPFSIPKAIQTDAPINPGNSGGPLLNLQGEVIGVNAQIETDGTSRANSGVGFAIPVSIVQRVVPELINNGEYIWPWLGVRGTSLRPASVEAMNLVVDKGAYITDVIANGPAAKAGLRGSTDTAIIDDRQVLIGGDVIVAINGEPVNSFSDLLIYVALETSPGQEVTLSVLRDGNLQEIRLILEPRPSTLSEEIPSLNP